MRKRVICLFLSILFALGIFLFGALTTVKSSTILSNEVSERWNKDWYLLEEDGTKALITLPCSIEGTANEPARIDHKLPTEYREGMSLGVLTVHQTLRAYVDGELLYEQFEEGSLKEGESPGTLWQIFRLPAETRGKILTLEFSSPYDSFSSEIPEVLYGSRSALLAHVAQVNAGYLFFSFLLAAAGVFFLGVHLTYSGMQELDKRLLYLGAFALLASVWILLYSGVLQVILNNSFVAAWGSYPIFIILPIPMLLFFDNAYQSKLPKLIVLQIALYAVLLGGSTVLHFTGLANYYDTIAFTHVMMILSIVWQLFVALTETIRYHNVNARRFLMITGVLLLVSAIDLINFYTLWFSVVFLFPVGLLLYIVLFGLDTAKRFRIIREQTLAAPYYQKLAFQDMLTKGKNRTAYTNALKVLEQDGAPENMRLLMFDLNDLKLINDRYGHQSGDDALIRTYHCITDAFGSAGDCYRIGGDEFACFLPPCPEEEFTAMRERFYEATAHENTQTGYPFAVAMGDARYDATAPFSFLELAEEADMALYRDKRRLKKHPEV